MSIYRYTHKHKYTHEHTRTHKQKYTLKYKHDHNIDESSKAFSIRTWVVGQYTY